MISLEACPERVHWRKCHHRTAITGRVQQGKITVQLYLLTASAIGFYFPHLEREPPVWTADVRELPRDPGCSRAHDTVCICSYVHIWLRLGFRFEPYCAVHWAVTSKCPPTSPCPCELKSSVCNPPAWVVPQLAYTYLPCIKMNDPRLGGSHPWIRFWKWVLRDVLSASRSQCAAAVLDFVWFLMIRIFLKKIHVRFESVIKRVCACLFFPFFLVACQCGEIVIEGMKLNA